MHNTACQHVSNLAHMSVSSVLDLHSINADPDPYEIGIRIGKANIMQIHARQDPPGSSKTRLCHVNFKKRYFSVQNQRVERRNEYRNPFMGKLFLILVIYDFFLILRWEKKIFCILIYIYLAVCELRRNYLSFHHRPKIKAAAWNHIFRTSMKNKQVPVLKIYSERY